VAQAAASDPVDLAMPSHTVPAGPVVAALADTVQSHIGRVVAAGRTALALVVVAVLRRIAFVGVPLAVGPVDVACVGQGHWCTLSEWY